MISHTLPQQEDRSTLQIDKQSLPIVHVLCVCHCDVEFSTAGDHEHMFWMFYLHWSVTHPLVLDVAWMLLVPVHDASDIRLNHTYTSLGCSLSLDKAAGEHTHSQVFITTSRVHRAVVLTVYIGW